MSSEDFFGIVWPGKAEAKEQAATPPLGSLRAPSAASAHGLYVGDNLDVLKHLIRGKAFMADVIYIDPPYNTGRDFTYRDNFRRKRTIGARDHGMWHAQWLSMMYPRLLLAAQLLSPTGFICISIGDDEVANLRKVCDEVFGEDCFAGQLIWRKAGTGKNDSRFAVVEHEYVLIYAGSPHAPSFNLDFGAEKSTQYRYSDELGKYSLIRLDSKTLGYLPTMDFPIQGPDGVTYTPPQPAGQEKVARWRWGKAKVSEHYDQLVFKRGHVYTKNYESKGARPRSILDGARFGVTRTGGKELERVLGAKGVFDFPKPVGLIKHLIALCGSHDATVLDFFAGSGTTGQAVAELNAQDGGTRSFHLIQRSEPTAPHSAAVKNGYTDIAQICAARLGALGIDFQTIELAQ